MTVVADHSLCATCADCAMGWNQWGKPRSYMSFIMSQDTYKWTIKKRHRPLLRTTTRAAYIVVPPWFFQLKNANWNSQCLVTGATVGAYRASSWVDFTSTDCRVALTRSSLLPVNKLLVPFKACLLLRTDYQSFCYLSIVKCLTSPHNWKDPSKRDC